MAVGDSNSWLSAPTLVYGPRKGGTTLLLRLIDTSGDVLAFPSETKFKNFERHRSSLQRRAPERYYKACRHLDLDHPLFDKTGYLEQVERIKGTQHNLATVIREDAKALAASIQGRKTPTTFVMKEVGGGSSARTVGLFRSTFPSGKIILITRDPRFVARAVYRARRRAGVRLGPMQLFRQALEPIRIADFQRQLILDSEMPILHVRHEDIVGGEIETTMKRVTSFLEVPFTDEFTRPTLFGQSTVVGTSSRQTTAVFREEANWQDDLTPREKAAIELAQRVGGWIYRPNQS